jgi:hypothetical protein
LNSGSSRAEDLAFGLKDALKAVMNGDLVLDDKPMQFILHSEDGT